jgi:hypothetical protein
MANAFTATVKDKKIKIHQTVEFVALLNGFEGKDIKITISNLKAKDQRSLAQNSYYWGVIVKEIADYVGEGLQDTHMNLKRMFFSDEMIKNTADGDTYLFYKECSTTQYDTKEFAERVENIRRWANDKDKGLGLNIPLPNEDINAYNFLT